MPTLALEDVLTEGSLCSLTTGVQDQEEGKEDRSYEMLGTSVNCKGGNVSVKANSKGYTQL